MKSLRYLMLAGLIGTSQISFTMYVEDDHYFFSMDYGLNDLILKNQTWLEEQLTQLGYKDLSAATIEDLVSYFESATNALHEQLIARNKEINADLFQEKMSHAMSKIVNAVIKLHEKVLSGKQDEITSNLVIAHIVDKYGGPLYRDAINQFPNNQDE